MSDNPTVLIHGDPWQVEHIREEVEWCRGQGGWTQRSWIARAALIDKHHSSPYRGQAIDPSKGQRVDPTGWEHDHCLVCWWTLCESPDPERGMGWSYDGEHWLCNECHEKFIVNDIISGVG